MTLTLLAQDLPTLGGSYDLVMLIARILHVLSAIILVGGLFYLWAVVRPSSSAPNSLDATDVSTADTYFAGRRAAWAKWVAIASLLLLATGLWNFVNMVTSNWLHFTYHILGTVKIVGGLALMALAALLAGRTAAADALRQKWRTWLTITLLLGITIVAIGSIMRTYPRTPKPNAEKDPTPVAAPAE